MRTAPFLYWWLALPLGLLIGCYSPTHFELLPGSQTGLTFANVITESDTFNALRFEYIYNGGGVGVADFDGDGRSDVYLAGNQVSSRLYLNRSGTAEPTNRAIRFQDVTGAAGVGTSVWCTGVAVADINQDGRPDLHVSTIQPGPLGNKPQPGVENIVWLNLGNGPDGIPRFRNVARQLGLADRSYSTQAAFLDYDLDGDIDLFLLNNALEKYSRNSIFPADTSGSARSVDKLYRNDGPGTDGLPHYTDVSLPEGIREHGWGLGVAINDVNQDGWPDIYCANDFQSNDVLYINQHDAAGRHTGFKNEIGTYLSHQSHNSMGVDMADINNDGLDDIAVMDMMPEDNLRQKTMFANTNYDAYERTQQMGYQPQFVRNMLQLNRGRSPMGHPVFSDIGYLAGVQATDWSWSALFADLDNDGWRDLLITNGYPKDITDLDFISYRESLSTFGAETPEQSRAYHKEAMKLPGVHKPNVLFRNRGGEPGGALRFANVADAWGLDQPAYTNGAAYADFDRDGDLDLVMNNLNAEAFVYRNNGAGADAPPTHYLRLRFEGLPGNRDGLGTSVTVWAGNRQWTAQHSLQRGYKSSVEPVMHIGLDMSVTQLDSVVVQWPGRGLRQVLRHVPADQVLTLRQTDARLPRLTTPSTPTLFQDITPVVNVPYQHKENLFVDFKQQPALPRLHSMQGPQLTVGDVNGDGLDDVYVGGASGQPGTLLLQQSGPRFVTRPLLRASAKDPKPMEETGVLLVDVDGDADLDLYCVGGGTEFYIDAPMYQDALFLNDGRGQFTSAPTGTLPNTRASGSCVVAADYDADGDQDLFVGGRVVPGRYPEAPRSYLLRNDTRTGGPVRFTDVTQQTAPGLANVGMVSAALWTDVDNDRHPDLLLVGEWMAPTLFRNVSGRLQRQATSLDSQTGWYSSLIGTDFDGDGDTDYVAGNLGLNSRYQASPAQPVSVYARDFDDSGTMDPVLSQFIQGVERPSAPRGTLIDQLAGTRRVAKTYADYGHLTMNDLLSADDRQQGLVLRATQMATIYIENRGKNQFVVRPLPLDTQFAPVQGGATPDLNRDGKPDLVLVGNAYDAEPLTGRYDASVGNVLMNQGGGQFKPMPMAQSGLCVQGDTRCLQPIRTHKPGEVLFVVSRNKGPLQFLKVR